MIEIREVFYASWEHEEELKLRNAVLRKPLGLNLYEQDLTLEKDYFRIAAFLKKDNSIAGSLLLVPIDDRIIQMKQMAVKESLQTMGIGREIISFAETFIEDRGYNEIILNARKNALDFYLKMGYQVRGEEFVEVGIPHFKMVKKIN